MKNPTMPQPPSKIVSTFPPKGDVQQFRLEQPHEFVCSRCERTKKSKLVAIQCGDWNMKLCNGCYGYFLANQ